LRLGPRSEVGHWDAEVHYGRADASRHRCCAARRRAATFGPRPLGAIGPLTPPPIGIPLRPIGRACAIATQVRVYVGLARLAAAMIFRLIAVSGGHRG